jgi:hypothetical protein
MIDAAISARSITKKQLALERYIETKKRFMGNLLEQELEITSYLI